MFMSAPFNESQNKVELMIKRCFDFLASLFLVVVLSPVLLGMALWVRLDSPAPVLYRQIRIGYQGKPFQVWKVRTMVENASELQAKLEAMNEVDGGVLFKMKDDPRITTAGKFLRKSSLDELPQLFNVLMGEMSLVGPRPLPVRDVQKFKNPEHHDRHVVIPGITGLWQVCGRSDTDSEDIFRKDFEYIANWSLLLDFQILLKTIVVVFLGKGAY
ncbi:MAG: exopolysaccharide biosynthesis polyprenyl glycosylphosphotransferase [Synechococcaceae cyanobacterium RL_1_2]|nr:exopolysaccharide biosynthesis polyprenyl glycosylphosphotransferase [Synechococcaceae cyanobacterium RL_1_2]